MRTNASKQRHSRLKGIVPSHAEAVAIITEPGDLAFVKRDALRSMVMRCPDGCGEAITINLDPRTDKAWRVYNSPKGITLFPSVWRDTGCKSHFILWNDTLYWMDGFGEEVDGQTTEATLDDRVWAVLSPSELIDFVAIADQLGEIPWAVQESCRRLAKAGRALRGRGQRRNMYKRI